MVLPFVVSGPWCRSTACLACTVFLDNIADGQVSETKGASVIKPLVFRGRMRVSPVAAFTLRLIVDIYGR